MDFPETRIEAHIKRSTRIFHLELYRVFVMVVSGLDFIYQIAHHDPHHRSILILVSGSADGHVETG